MLITLGVIGVVATITIPGLISAYKANQLRAQFLKSYSTIQQAFRQMEADDVSTDLATYSGKMGSFYNTYKQYFKGAHECGYYYDTSDALPCMGMPYGKNNYKSLDGKFVVYDDYFTDGQLVLPDGSLLMIDNPNWGDFLWLFVDLNGYATPPNRFGYDLFVFQFIDGELRTMGDKETEYNDIDKYCNINISTKTNGIACAHRAKTESDYFKWAVKNLK